MIGRMSRRSRSLASSESYVAATAPPTTARGPGSAPSSGRRRGVGNGGHRLPQRLDRPVRGGGAGLGLEHHVDLGDGRRRPRRARAEATPGTAAAAR